MSNTERSHRGVFEAATRSQDQASPRGRSTRSDEAQAGTRGVRDGYGDFAPGTLDLGRRRTSGSASVVTIGQVLAMLRRRVLVVLGTLVVTSLVALALFWSLPRAYDATAVVDLSPSLTGASSNSATISTTTEARIVTSMSVARVAAEDLSSRQSPQDLVQSVAVSSPLSSEVLDITFTGSSAQRAADGANAFARAYLTYRSATTEQNLDLRKKKVADEIDVLQSQLDKLDGQFSQRASSQRSLAQGQIGQLQSQLNDYRTSVSVAGELAGPATVPSSASSPKPLIFVAAGLMGGLILGVALAMVRDRRDDRVRAQDEVEDLTGLPVIANVPSRGRESRDARSSVASGRHLTGLLQSRGPESDAYRTTVTTLAPSDQQSGPRSMLLLGVGRQPGFNQVPLNLAATFAMQGLTTVLVGTSRAVRPAEDMLDLGRAEPAFGGVFRDRLRGPGSVPHLTVLPLGDEVALGATLRAHGNAIDAVLREADVIVVDGANTELVSTPLVLSQLVDAAIVIVGVRRTRRTDLESALGQLEKVGAAVIGALLVSKGSLRTRRAERRLAAVSAQLPSDGSRDRGADADESPSDVAHNRGGASAVAAGDGSREDRREDSDRRFLRSSDSRH